MNTKEIFKTGDRVFAIQFGWGLVTKTLLTSNYPLTVLFDSGYEDDFTLEGTLFIMDINPTLSFTEYTLEGFSQERPNPYIAVDTLLWVRDEDVWNLRYFSHFDKNGCATCFNVQKKSTETKDTQVWPEYSLTNPLI